MRNLKDKVRRDRARKCVNMHDFGYCGSLPEGVEDRMCFIMNPRKRYNSQTEEWELCDYCPFKGMYGFHVKQEETK